MISHGQTFEGHGQAVGELSMALILNRHTRHSLAAITFVRMHLLLVLLLICLAPVSQKSCAKTEDQGITS